MAHQIGKRDFQYGFVQAWHKLTRLIEAGKKMTADLFPDVQAVPLLYLLDGKQIELGGLREKQGAIVAVEPAQPEPKSKKGKGKAEQPPKELEKWGQHVAISLDDGLPCGEAFNIETYTLWTPRQGWEYIHDVLSGTDFEVESIGMLNNRSKWFISTRLKELEKIGNYGPNDRRNNHTFLNFSGGLDRNLTAQAEANNVLIVCANTLSLSRMSGTKLFSEKHTKNFHKALNDAKTEIEKVCGMAAVFQKQLDMLEKAPCNMKRAGHIFAGYLTPRSVETEAAKEGGTLEVSTRTKRMVSDLKLRFADGIGTQGESLYDVLNAFTELRTRGGAESKKDAWSQFESSEFGLLADEKAEFAAGLNDSETLEKWEKRGESLAPAFV